MSSMFEAEAATIGANGVEASLRSASPVYFLSSATDANRIEACSGTRIVSDAERVQSSYDPNAILPRGDWGKAALKKLDHPEPWRFSDHRFDCVALLRCPESVLRLIPPINSRRARPDQELMQDALRDICSLQGPMHIHRVIHNAPGYPTVTIDQHTERRIGLHVDNWDKLSIDKRNVSTNRISINVGECTRSFLFVPIGLSSVISILREDAVDVRASSNPTSLGRLFLRRYPNVSVFRVPVDPGCAYIAPTETLIHDASASEMTKGDYQITIRGYVDARAGQGDVYACAFK
jgi:hypothetical protein